MSFRSGKDSNNFKRSRNRFKDPGSSIRRNKDKRDKFERSNYQNQTNSNKNIEIENYIVSDKSNNNINYRDNDSKKNPYIRSSSSKYSSYNRNIDRGDRRFNRFGDGSRKSSRNLANVSHRQESSVSYSTFNSEEDLNDFQNDLIWGRHAAHAVLETGRPIHRIWCTTELRSSSQFFQLLKDSKSSGVLVEEVTWARLGQITKGAVHQGIALQIAASKTLSLVDLIKACDSIGENSLLLALDGLTDPQNLGAIVRSAEALGAHGLVLPQRRSAGLTGSVAKVAAGALEHLPVARVVNLNRALEKLKSNGYRVVGLAAEGEVTLPELDFDGPLVVVIGSEDKGISLLTRKACDQLVRIPLRGVTTSLNAAVATSVFLYEVARSGWMKGLSGRAPSPRLVRADFSQKQ